MSDEGGVTFWANPCPTKAILPRLRNSCPRAASARWENEEWYQSDLDDLESNLVEFFGQWEAFNVIPIGGKADSDDGADDEQVDEDDLVKYELKQKVACANSIIRAIRTTGAPCFNPSAVTEKGHIRVNHALRLSKGVNRMINSTRQYLRLNFLRLRHVRTQADEAARIAAEEQARREADEDAAHAAAVGKTQDCRDAQIRSWCGRQRQGTAGHE